MANHSDPEPATAARGRWHAIAAIAAIVACAALLASQAPLAQAPPPAVSVKTDSNGRLAYTADTDGNRIIDFSHAGYAGGGVAIPDVPPRVVLGPRAGQDRERIQAALDLVAALPPDAAGFRGAVQLEPGTYRIDTSLRIAASGVVLRGSGTADDATALVATGTSRRALLEIAGTGTATAVDGTRTPTTSAYVPAGTRSLDVRSADGLAPGTRVLVTRPSTATWIAALGMNLFPGWRPENRLHWQPGSRDIVWERTVTAVEGLTVTLDAPLTTALEARYGGGTLARASFPGRIARAGVENLKLVSEYDTARPMDEDHAWTAVSLDAVEDAWVRQVVTEHFAGSAVYLGASARAVTVEDVEARAPVSEVGGYRRHVFYTSGQQTLFRRCRSERGRHDFAVGFTAAGPNVFLECTAQDALDDSGPIESWASGVLYDNVVVRGHALRLTNRGTAGQGQGWTAANSVLWNSEATDVEVQSPPGAVNQAYGCKGVVTGDGIVWDPRTMPYRDFYRGMPVAPRSLYLAQLEERLGVAGVAAAEARPAPVGAAGARQLADAEVDAFVARGRDTAPPAGPLRAEHGVFTIDGRRAWTARAGYSWYQAQMPPSLARTFGPALTRFAPGLTGVGHTDDIDAMAAAMAPGTAFYQHYGLWYDRRRVDHNYYGSPDQRTGDVWPPFMELPWARSGVGRAWDGLSRYDLTRFNPWYFERVASFAREARRRGLVLYYNFYFQHWLLESRSHYVDFPWRPVNTIQDTGLPNEVPAANTFYDLSHPVRRDLHRRYIRHALDALGGQTNVVFGIDREYTGPLSFVTFWLDTIAEWQRERGRQVFVALEVPKDQLDAILDDPVRGKMIAAVDVLGWVYRADGRLFAARGGIDRAPREQRPDIALPAELEALKQKLGPTGLDQRDFLNGPEFQRLFDTLWAGSVPMRYRAWREYRDRVPHVVTLWQADEYPALTAALERAVPAAARAGARPTDAVSAPRDTAWAVGTPGETMLVYSVAGLPVELDLRRFEGRYTVAWVHAGTGTLVPEPKPVRGGQLVTITPPPAAAGKSTAAWLTRVR